MDIQNFYNTIGENYTEVIGRLGSDKLISRLLTKILSDDNMSKLEAALDSKDVDTAFMAVHTLKGISLNMGFSKLASCASRLTEKLRNKDLSGTEELLAEVKSEYSSVIEAINSLNK